MNRRTFMKRASTGSAGFALGGFMARAYGRAEAIGPLAATALSAAAAASPTLAATAFTATSTGAGL